MLDAEYTWMDEEFHEELVTPQQLTVFLTTAGGISAHIFSGTVSLSTGWRSAVSSRSASGWQTSCFRKAKDGSCKRIKT